MLTTRRPRAGGALPASSRSRRHVKAGGTAPLNGGIRLISAALRIHHPHSLRPPAGAAKEPKTTLGRQSARPSGARHDATRGLATAWEACAGVLLAEHLPCADGALVSCWPHAGSLLTRYRPCADDRPRTACWVKSGTRSRTSCVAALASVLPPQACACASRPVRWCACSRCSVVFHGTVQCAWGCARPWTDPGRLRLSRSRRDDPAQRRRYARPLFFWLKCWSPCNHVSLTRPRPHRTFAGGIRMTYCRFADNALTLCRRCAGVVLTVC